MPRLVAASLLGLLALAAPASDATAKKRRKGPPPAPETMRSELYEIARPPGEGWLLVGGDGQSVVLARDGAADPGGRPDDTWAAQVLLAPPSRSATVAELQNEVESGYRDALAASGRFDVRAWSAAPDPARPDRCLAYRVLAADRAAALADGRPGELLLEERGVFCLLDAPARATLNAKLSHRGAGVATEALAASAAEWLGTLVLAGARTTP